VATPIAAAVSAGVSALGARLGGVTSTGPGLLELVPGRVHNAVSLPTVLKQASAAQVSSAVDMLAGALKAGVGVDVPPALVSAAKANPDRVADMLVLTTQQMHVAFDALHGAHTARGGAPLVKPTHLPRTTNTAKLDAVDIQRPAGDLKQLTPQLMRGDVPNTNLSDAAAKKNIVLAEIIDRLASNPGKAKNEQFVVEHAGSRFTSLPGFLKALAADGYTIETKITHRVADFVGLKTKAPDGTIIDVPVAAMIKTGFKDAAGKEAFVPTVHSEFVFSIRAGAASKQPHLDGDIKWYQGISGTGFFPCDLMRSSTWTGGTVAAEFNNADSYKAIGLCGVFADVVQDVSAQANLAMAGYGITGVCNDSVAVIQQAMTGTSTAYPLFMRDAVLTPAITARLNDKNHTDDASLKILAAAMAAVPADDVANASARTRALASLPWAAGQEPFASTEEARRILQS
jgi:hypothetical protein